MSLSKVLRGTATGRHYVFVGCISIGMIASTFAFPRVYAAIVYRDPYAEMARFDPALGSIFPLPSRDSLGQAIPRKRALVVLLGECGSCSINSFERNKLREPEGTIVVIVVDATKEKIPSSILKSKRAFVIADANATNTKLANAQWHPRLLLLDENYALKWIQARPDKAPPGATYER